MIKEIRFDPFGNILENTNPTLRIPIGFAGGLHDRDLDLIRFGWRDYDPFTGRWTAPDPMGDAGGDDDWYGYCLDDPVNGIDPLGLMLGLAAAGAVVGVARAAATYGPSIARAARTYGSAAYRAAARFGPKALEEIEQNMLGYPSVTDLPDYLKEFLDDLQNEANDSKESRRDKFDSYDRARKQSLSPSRARDIAKREEDAISRAEESVQARKERASERNKQRENDNDKLGPDARDRLRSTFKQYEQAKSNRERNGWSGPSGNIGSRKGSYGDYGR